MTLQNMLEMHDCKSKDVIKWPKHYKRLPAGYIVVRVDDRYMWINEHAQASISDTSKYVVRRWAFINAQVTRKTNSKVQLDSSKER
ncbi:hypothetical protein LCGC14_2786860 [marine sediment metagenome]|uniref:Uncharacterized protein n=1 Tax=marine sediment metagenome TaxID=412755 RepID=A0A0F9B0A1_9ZZZZ